jgi:hypothetical protein
MTVAAGVVLSCIIACFIGFVLQKTTTVKINKAAQKLKDSALVMSIEMNKAETAHTAYKKVSGEEKAAKDETEAVAWKETMAKKKTIADAAKAGKAAPAPEALD